MENEVPDEVQRAISSLWRRRFPDPENSYNTREFVDLRSVCTRHYATGGEFWFTSSLWEILKSLGCPMILRDHADRALTASAAAQLLHATLTSTSAKTTHLCPLDWSDPMIMLAFGPNRVGQFAADELRTLADAPRLGRVFPTTEPDWDRLSEFQWLIVEEHNRVDDEPGARTNPFFHRMPADLGAFEAHEDQFPRPVEEALMFMLLAPWEDWSTYQEVDWRGFRIPWIFSRNEDLCIPLGSPPMDSNLSWHPDIFENSYGETIYSERPSTSQLSDDASTLPSYLEQQNWHDMTTALATPLFQTPIRHFFVRAFNSKGIDEFIAHLTTIEAALGLQSDYASRPPGDPRQKMGVTKILKSRIANLLGDPHAKQEYEDLFNIRSAYVHGRTMSAISSRNRRRARAMARRVVTALIVAACTQASPINREAFLNSLL